MGFRRLLNWVSEALHVRHEQGRSPDKFQNRRIEIEALEPRILFSADLNPFAQYPQTLQNTAGATAEIRLIDPPVTTSNAQIQL